MNLLRKERSQRSLLRNSVPAARPQGFESLGASLSLGNTANFTFLASSGVGKDESSSRPGVRCGGREESLEISSRSSVRVSGTKKSVDGSDIGRFVAVLSVSKWTGGINKELQHRVLEKFNGLIRRHCDRLPLACVVQPGTGNWDCGGTNVKDNACSGMVAPDPHKRVLILMSDTGGGHRASAEAIKATFELEYGDEYIVNIVDLWKDHTPWPFNQVPRTYNFLVKHETLWKFTFHGTRPRLIHQTNFAATGIFIAREVAKGILKHKPDVIVSVHPLMQHIPLRILKTRGLLDRIPFTTVITDLNTCHPTWFHKLTTVCFCPSKEVAQRALKAGLKQSQIRVHGLPVRPSFSRPTRSKDELRRELGMEEDLSAVLLMGGGEGMGPVEETARALGDALKCPHSGKPLGQLIVICGRNKRLANRLKAVEWSIPVQIRGFETNMQEWMGACDCIITKAGPGTIAEAMIRGLPVIINDYIAGQEVGNVPYVVDNGVGKYCENPNEIALTVAEWFTTKRKELAQMAENAWKLARPDAVFRIVHDLADLAHQKGLLTQPQALAF
ncbi:monogalactosyldiacylglycerol synthase [Selaginella moellendorffii]|uniref:monogalactosyldiacylglycerol synthase n=1 Tax=Selaginella moellendorffii TaxID=88036 RepID=D8RQT3_SELML|nr:monogalactosyldiacylglycerol synthase, chloroplastic isoform X2 [Selaginella moellendorffii]EFJ25510.1 monogalactosyldiacylglycerol synthase [Selaginella moellendorffii]|eukprot:XP_002973136.1 monogalactosyldiacylglycerol synthase, chloroplastic isoform X2 [Selaginella moellendorffii]